MGGAAGQFLDSGSFPKNTHFYPINKIRGRSKKLRTTRGVIFRQGSERIYLDKSCKKNHNKRVSTNILKTSLNLCPYIGLEITLRVHSNSCVMFLCVPPVISTLATPRGILFLGRDEGPSLRQKTTNLGATQIH